jgi:hypothetical protein
MVIANMASYFVHEECPVHQTEALINSSLKDQSHILEDRFKDNAIAP